MNIVSVCRPDDWVDTHLLRWRSTIYRTTPAAKCYLALLKRDNDDSALVHAVMDKLGPHFAEIKVVKDQPKVRGFSVFVDKLRACMLDIFQLDDALYTDIDMDIVDDLRHIPSLGTEDILWTPNLVRNGSVARALAAFGLAKNVTYVEPATIFLRRSFAAEYDAAIKTGKLNLDDYLPGVNIWNVVVHSHDSHRLIGYRYNTCFWHVSDPDHTAPVSIVHFCGVRGKQMRWHLDLNDWPTSAKYLRKSSLPLDYTWETLCPSLNK